MWENGPLRSSGSCGYGSDIVFGVLGLEMGGVGNVADVQGDG